jgi:hypothetical protein
MDGLDVTSGRDSSGRFMPGTSGNPAGKRPGTRNRRTVLAEALREGEDAAVARVVIDKALAGDAVAARFLLGLLSPKPRSRTIELDLPEGARTGDVVAAFDATLAAMAAGEITPDEALVVTRVLDGRRRVLDAVARERRLAEEETQKQASAALQPELDAMPCADQTGDDGDTPDAGDATEAFLYSACNSPTPASMQGSVARLPAEERRLVAAMAWQPRAAAYGAALPR